MVFSNNVHIHILKNENATHREFGLGGEVVLKLLKLAEVLPQKKFLENYFISVKLLRHLADEGHCGTIRQGRIEDY